MIWGTREVASPGRGERKFAGAFHRFSSYNGAQCGV
jgi:hypothetical protein